MWEVLKFERFRLWRPKFRGFVPLNVKTIKTTTCLIRVKTLFFLLFSLATANRSLASHSMGSDLTYRCLGGNSYEITLSFYRDCAGIDADPAAEIFFLVLTILPLVMVEHLQEFRNTFIEV